MHVFSLESQAISEQIARTRAALGTPDAMDELRTLSQLGVHYAKKGDFHPVPAVRHGYSGPSDVVWGVDDEIRAELRALLGAGAGRGLARARREGPHPR